MTSTLTRGRPRATAELTFVEDRRVLYVPHEAEVPEWAVRSVFEIRSFLTDVLRPDDIAMELADVLRAMRTACRKFVETIGDWRGPRIIVPTPGDILGEGTTSWVFNQALGELRSVFGIHLAQIAVRYALDVPDALAIILPLSQRRTVGRTRLT